MTFGAFGSPLALLGPLTLGGILGFAAGFFLRRLGRFLLLWLGLAFVGLQLLAYTGYIDINWLKIQQDVAPLLSPGTLSGFWNLIRGVLTHNLPFVAGMIPGLLLGLRRR
jgi:uncharacterized membrane protein (Fun14 family)